MNRQPDNQASPQERVRTAARFAAIGRRPGGTVPGAAKPAEAGTKKNIQTVLRMTHASVMRQTLILQICCWLAAFVAGAQAADPASMLLETAGTVEYFSPSTTNWQTAAAGLALHAGDRVRTRAQSRAAVELSDRSVIRLDELTTLEILAPRNAEKKRFGLLHGAIYFFNREKPADVEFDTPLAAGAIRGTEFLLEAPDADHVHLALIDGLVSMKSATEEIALQRGEEASLETGKPAQKMALVNATAKIQWALYYPGIVDGDELMFDAAEQSALGGVLNDYRAGDLLGALAAWPSAPDPDSDRVKIFRAQLELAVGRVKEAEELLAGLPENPPVMALRELIGVVRGEKPGVAATTQSPSLLLAHSYLLQAGTDLNGARTAAVSAVKLAPNFGFAHAQLAELEFAAGNRRAALGELNRALQLSPRLAAAHALQGFVLLDQGQYAMAESSFDRARQLDAALGAAWLGRGLCLLHARDYAGARAALQAAAALEPQRSLFRSYLGKIASEQGEARMAEKEFRLAKELDANDPTPWLYSALHLWQENKLNAAIRDLEVSSDKNDNRAAFRSRELLDGDRSVRSANLAAIYDDAGLTEVSRHVAQRSVSESYANFSGHLFLANSYQTEQDANRFDLRLETARQSELLVANLLAPPGAGNLSQVLSQSDRMRFFEEKPFGVSSLTGYGSGGDWSETATVFGSSGGFSYAFDTVYQSLTGERVNNGSENRDFVLTMKQRVTADDEVYLQIGDFRSNAGDIAQRYDPATAAPDFQVNEKQEPDVYLGWHHAWSPGSHTLLLFSRLQDDFTQHNGNQDVLFLGTDISGVNILGAQNGPLTPAPTGNGPLISDLKSRFTLYSADLQQVWENETFSLVTGGRWQSGTDDTKSLQTDQIGSAPNVVTDQKVSGDLQRGDIYAYGSWQVTKQLRVIGGVDYSHIQFPKNLDLSPITTGESERNLIAPKAGLLFQPWNRGLLRAAWTRSLGGLYFDNSVRLEPTEVGGFNQAYRSLLPESVAGIVPGSSFETISLGFDQSLASGTFLGVETEQLTSRGERNVGDFQFFAELLQANNANTTRQQLDFRERNVSVYAAQLLGDYFSASARWRMSEAKLTSEFPDIPSGTAGLSQLEQNNRAVLDQVTLALNFNLPCGLFAQWESTWYHQNNFGYTPSLAGADFWQHNVMVGWRFAHRHAEIRAGILDVADTDYRLNPLNLHGDLPRTRTFVASLRLNF